MIRFLWPLLLVPFFFLFKSGKEEMPVGPASMDQARKDFTVERIGTLDKALSEVSGWVFVNDSTLIAHNDGGNDPILFVLNEDGTIRKRVRIQGIKNIDQEDIAFNGTDRLFLGDFGNNNNTRKDLAVYSIPLASVLNDTVATGTVLKFHYPEQSAFPAPDSLKYYDAEAMTFCNNALWIITKCRTKPFDGIAKIYRLDTQSDKQSSKLTSQLKTGSGTWMKDAVTAADYKKGMLYLLTYDRLILVKGFPEKPVIDREIPLGLSQKEALAVNSKGEILVADERQPVLGGGRIFKITFKK